MPRFLLARTGWWSSDGTDVSISWSVGLALLGTVGLYTLVLDPIQETYIGQLFLARGKTPYVIAFFTLWASSMLLLKLTLLGAQRWPIERVLRIALESNGTPARRDARLSHELPGWPRAMQRTFLARRLASLTEPRREDNDADHARVVDDHSALDEDRVESGYGMLRLCIWAIPILGFIGTVLGIGESVAAFTRTIGEGSDIEEMKGSLASVTTGLSVAFDTTLLALVMSILVMIPTSALHKLELGILTAVEEYCRFSFVRNGNRDGATPQSTSGTGS